jgi:phosphoribosylaminoimidazolecarboxamide formyltransferase / IMP cyclohydrolase
MSMNIVRKIDNLVKVRTVLMSVSDKTGLESFIPALVSINPDIRILSTGGTYNRVKEILGGKADAHLTQVSSYTGQPETQGGLVKTLDFKIYLGLLTETYNADHQDDLKRTGAVPIDMVVVNLYPFQKTVANPDVTMEQARGNIDIGGPCMIRAGAKNFIRVAPVVDPSDYPAIVRELEARKGMTTLEMRVELARRAFSHTAQYDRDIADYFIKSTFDRVQQSYEEIL